jgi:hypothetical protein
VGHRLAVPTPDESRGDRTGRSVVFGVADDDGCAHRPCRIGSSAGLDGRKESEAGMPKLERVYVCEARVGSMPSSAADILLPLSVQ